MVTAARPTTQLGVGHLSIGAAERQYVDDVLSTGRLSYGPYSRAFEQRVAALHGVRFAALCNSGTSALQVALHALKIKYGYQDGDEVIVPALTFVATVNIVLQNNLTPVLVDVDPIYYEIDPEKIEAAITPRTRAIIPVHIGGLPCEMDAIMAIARAHNLQVLEDSCETMFANYGGFPVGSWGDAACFSTYIAHLLTTGVGGLACTSDPELAVLIRSLMNHGRDGIYLSIDDDAGLSGDALREVMTRRFVFEHVGYSYRATELEAAIGCGQIERWKEDQRRRHQIATALRDRLHWAETMGLLQVPRTRANATHGWMFFPLVMGALFKGSTVDLTAFLEERGIETRPLLPIVTQPIYQKMGLVKPGQFPNADYLAEHAFYVGCHPGLTDADVDYLVDTISEGVRRADVQP